jgi:hypothetical protein
VHRFFFFFFAMAAEEELLRRSTALTSPYQPPFPHGEEQKQMEVPPTEKKRTTRVTHPSAQSAARRIEAFHTSHASALLSLRATAVCGAYDLLDDFYESCRTVIVFEMWKLKRTALWEHWMTQLEHHVNAYRALNDRQAFAGNLYVDAAKEKKDVFVRDQRRRNDFLRVRRDETAVYVQGLQKHPLYMSPASLSHTADTRAIPVAELGHEGVALGGLASSITLSAKQNRDGATKPSTTSSKFVENVLKRMARAAAAAASISHQTPLSSSYMTSSPPPDLTPLAGPLVPSQSGPHGRTPPEHHHHHEHEHAADSKYHDALMRQTSPPPSAVLQQRPLSSNRTPAVTFSVAGSH